MTTHEDVTRMTLGQSVETLDGVAEGCWLVETMGSFHIWDLGAMTYERVPGPASIAGSMDYDGETFKIYSIDWWPKIGGQSLVYYEDPSDPVAMTQFRRSSSIRSIRRIVDDEPEEPSA